MRGLHIKISLLYQILLLILVVWIDFHHGYDVNGAVLSLLLSFLFLLLDDILVRVISIRSKFLQHTLWTIRLAQVQSLLLLEIVTLPFLVRYVVAVTLFNLISLVIAELVTQTSGLKGFKWNLLVGLGVGCLFHLSARISLIFVAYLLGVIVSVTIEVYKRMNLSTFLSSRNWSYWLILLVFLLDALGINVILEFSLREQLFSGIWQISTALLIVIFFGVLLFNNRSFLVNKTWISLILLAFLSYWIIFAYILRYKVEEVLTTELIVFLLAYIGKTLSDLSLALGDHPLEYGGLAALIREEKLKEEFADFLHDDILQDINAMIQLSGLRDSDTALPMIHENLQRLNSFTRRQMNLYSPQLLKGLSLYENYLQLIELFRSRYPDAGMDISFEMNPDARLSPPYDVLVYRWLRELINNSFKYSRGKHLTVTVEIVDNRCRLAVTDDGVYQKGMELGKGHGLKTVMAQVTAIGGQVQLFQANGHGLGITIIFEIEGDRAIESFIDR